MATMYLGVAVYEELVCQPERSNAHDQYAVAVMQIEKEEV